MCNTNCDADDLRSISGWNSCKGLGKADRFQTKWLNLSSAACMGRPGLQVLGITYP